VLKHKLPALLYRKIVLWFELLNVDGRAECNSAIATLLCTVCFPLLLVDGVAPQLPDTWFYYWIQLQELNLFSIFPDIALGTYKDGLYTKYATSIIVILNFHFIIIEARNKLRDKLIRTHYCDFFCTKCIKWLHNLEAVYVHQPALLFPKLLNGFRWNFVLWIWIKSCLNSVLTALIGALYTRAINITQIELLTNFQNGQIRLKIEVLK